MTSFATDPNLERLSLGRVQRLRRLALLFAALTATLAFPLVTDVGSRETVLNESVEIAGMMLIVMAILGRSWCTLYIGGHKAREIVATGPYSISRNPLYFFSLIGIFGIGAQTGSVFLGPIFFVVGIAIFFPVVLREEKALASRFGPAYDAYRARVPRFGPRLSEWTDLTIVPVIPGKLWRTVREGMLLLLAIPLCEAAEWLQESAVFLPIINIP